MALQSFRSLQMQHAAAGLLQPGPAAAAAAAAGSLLQCAAGSSNDTSWSRSLSSSSSSSITSSSSSNHDSLLASQQRWYHAHRGIPPIHGTTVLCVRRDGEVVMMADGQISSGSKIVKPNARKLRRLATDPVPSLGGFAGSTADALTLFERLEQRLEEHPGQLRRSAVELAKAWRQDRVLRHLEATMIIADASTCLEVSGNGELLEPADGVHAIGSGSRFAIAAARALMTVPGLSALEVARRAMGIAAAKCVYTNDCFLWEVISQDGQLQSGGSSEATGRDNGSGSSSGGDSRSGGGSGSGSGSQ